MLDLLEQVKKNSEFAVGRQIEFMMRDGKSMRIGTIVGHDRGDGIVNCTCKEHRIQTFRVDILVHPPKAI